MRLRPHLTLLSLQLTLFPLHAGHINEVVLLLVPVVPVQLLEGGCSEANPPLALLSLQLTLFPLPAGHGNEVVLLPVPAVPVQLLEGSRGEAPPSSPAIVPSGNPSPPTYWKR